MANLAQYLFQRAQANPESIAIIDKTVKTNEPERPPQMALHGYGVAELRFSEFAARIKRLAGGLTALAQTSHGDRVVICMENRPEFFDLCHRITQSMQDRIRVLAEHRRTLDDSRRSRKFDRHAYVEPFAALRMVKLDIHLTTAHMFIIQPFSGRSMMRLFATHPSTEQRIARLQALR